jgi:hypothetical protein
MPKWIIFEYLHPRHGNLMRKWADGLQKKERAKLDQRVDSLAMHGTSLIPGTVAPTGVASIFKLKVQGQVKLRPMLCEGPGDKTSFTFLLGAKEVQFAYDPEDAPNTAASYRQDLISNPDRREINERINRKVKD